MARFIRLLKSDNKEQDLKLACENLRADQFDDRVFEVDPATFTKVPNAPFAYWVSEELLNTFIRLPKFENSERTAWVGLQTGDDFQWLRLFWENSGSTSDYFSLVPITKGGGRSDYFSEYPLSIRWGKNGELIRSWKSDQLRKALITANNSKLWNESRYFQPGVTWSRRAHLRGSFRLLPKGAIFSDSSPCAFDPDPLTLVAILNSTPYLFLLSLLMPRGSDGGQTLKYETGYVTAVPIPDVSEKERNLLADLAMRGWVANYSKSQIVETSRNFILPAALQALLGARDLDSIEAELGEIQTKIDAIAFELYGFEEVDRVAALGSIGTTDGDEIEGGDDDGEDDDSATEVNQTEGLLCWATGVAFGRFDLRLATGERAIPSVPEPFDFLPAESPGMLPDDAAPFHAHSGILVDDQGHPHDLVHLIEEVLARIKAPVPTDVRRWVQRDFFPLHLKQYSKSRRKAPIYWPISTNSGSYTLWLYYPSLSDQTLFIAINDFIEPKLKQVGQDIASLRSQGSARSRDEEKVFEVLQGLELELIELRGSLLAIAARYHPHHDDGVQITAAPLWQLFRHRPWQTALKDTWAKLEKGDYDWAHLAKSYWLDRVRKRCTTDKSLAIAHGLEDLYIEPEAKLNKARGKEKAGGDE